MIQARLVGVLLLDEGQLAQLAHLDVALHSLGERLGPALVGQGGAAGRQATLGGGGGLRLLLVVEVVEDALDVVVGVGEAADSLEDLGELLLRGLLDSRMKIGHCWMMMLGVSEAKYPESGDVDFFQVMLIFQGDVKREA